MNVYLTGATGFVGSYVLRELIRGGHNVRCLVRGEPRQLSVESADVEQVEGSITDPPSLDGTMADCEAVVHLVGILDEKPSKGMTFEAVHYEGTKAVVNEALDAGVTTFIHMSSNGARSDGVSDYQRTKWKAEQYVKEADFSHWTIFQPTLIFGDPGPDNPEFASRIARQLVKPFPVLPVFGDGEFEMQPISIEEVAAAFVQALTREAANGRTYPAGGQELMSYKELLDRITDGVGHGRKKKIPVAMAVMRPAVQTLGRTGLLPISPDQFEMLVEGNTCDSRAFYRDFDVTAKPFTAENLSYLRRRK